MIDRCPLSSKFRPIVSCISCYWPCPLSYANLLTLPVIDLLV